MVDIIIVLNIVITDYNYGDWSTLPRRHSGPIYPVYFVCTGDEERLSQCESHNITGSQSRYVELYCESGMYICINIYSTLHI